MAKRQRMERWKLLQKKTSSKKSNHQGIKRFHLNFSLQINSKKYHHDKSK